MSQPPYFTPPSHQSTLLGSTQGPQLLAAERLKASFDPQDLRRYLHGEDYIKRQARVLALLEHEPAFEKGRLHYLGREDKFKAGLAKEKRLTSIAMGEGFGSEEMAVAAELLDMPASFELHRSMFLNTLANQSTEEQKELFYGPASRFEIIGCYSQTELGHGSNVQALETTATYNPGTQTFTLHTPSLTAAKWWSGGLGAVADHAIVIAQLITPDGPNGTLVRRGPHPFVVQLRDVKTREPLQGRVMGDVGPKMGFGMVDNGTLFLDNVQVPHVNFLAKYTKVDKATGAFSKPPNSKLAYGTMVFVRSSIVQRARMVLARAATIAIRYCAVRSQFGSPEETQVLDYQLVQARIFVPLVQAFACHYTGREMYRLYNLNQTSMAGGDFTLLADVHASSSGLKSICTIMASQGIEDCRRACGGHGYSLASGLGSFYADYLPEVTWEGDSYMLTQQVGRYLFKTFRTLLADRQAPMSRENRTRDYFVKFLNQREAGIAPSTTFSDPLSFADAFGQRAAHLVAGAVHKMDSEGVVWNDLLVDIYRCSVAHSQFVLISNFAEAIVRDEHLKALPKVHEVLIACFNLFACHTLTTEASEFLSYNLITPAQHSDLRARVFSSLKLLRPQAVALVDGFGIPDFQLDSALGRFDGDVYLNLLKFAQNEPLNRLRFNVDYRDADLVVGEPGVQTKAKL